MRRSTFLLSAILALGLAAPAASASFPATLPLPNGFAPEGIAVGRGATFFSGSLSGMGIWRGDLRTGAGSLLVEAGGPFTGMKVDARDRLWVAGGAAGNGYLFDATTGASLATFAFAAAPSFVNDVVVTTDAAYFTDSFQPVIYRVPIAAGGAIGSFEPIELDPDAIGFVPGGFNLNGIDATADGATLVAVNTTTGGLVAIDADSGASRSIDSGGADLTNADGILLAGQALFVVRNANNSIVELRLAPDLSDAAQVATIGSDDFAVPTTIARFGSALYAVNARFGVPPTPTTPYWVTRVAR